MDTNKKPNSRNLAIQTLERMISYLDVTANQTALSAGDRNLWADVIDIHKKARKWASNSDTNVQALHLLATLLVNSPSDFFNMQFEAYLQSDLITKKMKGYVYDCVLKILRGQYNSDSLAVSRRQLFDSVEQGDCYQFLMRPKTELTSLSTLVGRLDLISEILFFKRSGSIDPMYFDTCADIVVQMSAHTLAYGFQLLTHLFDFSSSTTDLDLFYIACRALRTIADLESGFQQKAACTLDDDYHETIKNLAMTFGPKVCKTLTLLVGQIGYHIMGVSQTVMEPVSLRKLKIPIAKAALQAPQNNSDVMDILADVLGSSAGFTAENPRKLVTQPQLTLLNGSKTSSRISMLYTMEHQLLTAFTSSNEMIDVPVEKLNNKMHAFLQEWFFLCSFDDANPMDFLLTTPKEPSTGYNRKQNQIIENPAPYVKTLLEIIKVVPFLPFDQLIHGTWFVGQFLNHPVDEIRLEASQSVQRVFEQNPEARLK
jgi:hypothetical protein